MITSVKANARLLLSFFVLLALLLPALVMIPGQADAALADSAWPMFQHDLKHTGRSPYVGPQTNSIKWSLTLDAGYTYSPITGSDGTIYVGCENGGTVFYAINPNGTVKWQRSLNTLHNSSAAISSDGTLYVPLDDKLLALSSVDGSTKWSYTTEPGWIYGNPAIAPDGTIYIGARFHLYALSDNGTNAVLKWKSGAFDTSDEIIGSSPAVGSDGTIYIGGRMFLHAFTDNGNSGTEKWTADMVTNYHATAPSIGDDGTIYVNTGNGFLRAYTDTGTEGTEKWSSPFGGLGTSLTSPAIGSDGTIYVGSNVDPGAFYAVTDNGTNCFAKWSRSDVGLVFASAAIGADGTVYTCNYSGTFYAFNPADGSTKWSYDAPFSNRNSGSIGSDGTLYFGTYDHKLYAFGVLNQTYVNAATGNDSYNGSSPTFISGIVGPKKTIAGGIAAVATNGTVNVAAGTYHEHGLHLSQNMNLAGAGALTTIIDGDAAGRVLEVSSAPFQLNIISGFTIRNGAPAGSDPGGGVYVSSSHILTMNDCAIVSNVKGDGSGLQPNRGGGICNDGGNVSLNRCTISGNSAGAFGGGIANLGSGSPFGQMDITNCTIYGNTVTGTNSGGGGIYTDRNATTNLLNVTIAGNNAMSTGSYGGGFANSSPESMYFKNCIVSGNTAANSARANGFDETGTGVHSQGYNIDSQNSCYFNQPTDQINTNPLLGALQNNGGQTSTMAITSSSPAYNKGTSSGAPSTDQRGITRPQGGIVDIGSFELQVQSAQVATATGTGLATFNVSSGSISNLTALSATSCAPMSSLNFPHGFFSFNITGLSNGATVTVTITLPSNMPAGTQYWKCINSQWVNASSLLGSNDGDNIITLTLTDGGLGDADGSANGTIVDPGGPAFTRASSPKPFADSSSSPQMPQALPAHMAVKYLNVLPQTALANQPITISANIANSGDEAGKYTATLKINGQVEQVKNGSVDGHVAKPISFTVTKDKPGTYQVDINGQQSSFTITGALNSQVPARTIVIIAIMILIAFIAMILVFLVRRRRAE